MRSRSTRPAAWPPIGDVSGSDVPRRLSFILPPVCEPGPRLRRRQLHGERLVQLVLPWARTEAAQTRYFVGVRPNDPALESVGFLFGVPRQLQEARQAGDPSTPGYAGNTNLEQISDWLTKILVGVGLTQILQIPGQIQRLTSFLAPALGNESSSQVFALGLLGYFSIAGFLIGYLSTRLLLARAFEQADGLALGIKDTTKETQEHTVEVVTQPADQPA